MDNSRESNGARTDGTITWIDRWADAEAIGADSDGRAPAIRRRDALSLLAPAGLALVYGVVALIAGGAVFDTGRPWPAGAVAFALLGFLFVVAGYGTVSVHDDARRVTRSRVDWRPNPWRYITAGAVALTGLQAVRFAVAGRVVPDPVPVYAGTFVVALAVSSLVAGPLYLLQRLRHT